MQAQKSGEKFPPAANKNMEFIFINKEWAKVCKTLILVLIIIHLLSAAWSTAMLIHHCGTYNFILINLGQGD